MSFAAILSRATERILAQSGEGALLRGTASLHPVYIGRDVDMIDGQGNVSVAAYIATISNADAPASDDTLVIAAGPNAGSYVLEKPVDDNGYSSRFILRKVSP